MKVPQGKRINVNGTIYRQGEELPKEKKVTLPSRTKAEKPTTQTRGGKDG